MDFLLENCPYCLGDPYQYATDSDGKRFPIAVICCKTSIEMAYLSLNALDTGNSNTTALKTLPPPEQD